MCVSILSYLYSIRFRIYIIEKYLRSLNAEKCTGDKKVFSPNMDSINIIFSVASIEVEINFSQNKKFIDNCFLQSPNPLQGHLPPPNAKSYNDYRSGKNHPSRMSHILWFCICSWSSYFSSAHGTRGRICICRHRDSSQILWIFCRAKVFLCCDKVFLVQPGGGNQTLGLRLKSWRLIWWSGCWVLRWNFFCGVRSWIEGNY